LIRIKTISTKQIRAGAPSNNRKIALGLKFPAPLLSVADEVIG
jgi:hypothetical protein